MAQDAIFDRVGLAQPHQSRWPVAPYQTNIRNSPQHKNEWSHKISRPQKCPNREKTIESCLHKLLRMGVFIRKVRIGKKKKIHKSRVYNTKDQPSDARFTHMNLWGGDDSELQLVYCIKSMSRPQTVELPTRAVPYMCVCYTVYCHPIYSGRQVCGRTSRGHTRFLRLLSAAFTLIFPARRIQPFLSLVSTVKSNFV